jgi:hypothetical protein
MIALESMKVVKKIKKMMRMLIMKNDYVLVNWRLIILKLYIKI